MIKLKEGDKAPAFSSTNEKGEAVSLADYNGKKLVLYFYPKDSTPGCTAEACDLRDNYHIFKEQGYEILGVSPDSAASHLKFISKYELPFSLLVDTDHSVAECFGAWGQKSMYGREYMGILRSTFVINSDGIIEKIIEKVNTKAHSKQLI
ncbi:MAG: thioredoxin-dependent thiol peroxidase [Bacteroidia bacterium]|nr:thioredoxin-dependent thiol peroxidase [Bacteroidia bacterium]